MKNLWNSKAVNIILLVASVVTGALLSLQTDHPAFHTHLIAHALVAVYALEKILKDKPATVEEAVADVLGKKNPPPSGPSAAAVLLLAAFLPLSGCPKPSPTPNTPDAADAGSTVTPGGAFSACTSDAVKATAKGLLGKVATAVATGNYVGQLAQLMGEFGEAEVTCAVQLFVDSLHRKAAFDSLARAQLTNSNAWLASRGVGK